MSGILLARRMGGAKTAIVLPAIGDAWLGGYFFGVMDTTNGNIIAADAYQTGARFACIASGKSLENTGLKWATSAGVTSLARTLWDGLSATTAMNSSSYPAAHYCAGLAKPSGDAASAWYLPALDELELMYRNLKPTTDSNNTGSKTGDFPPYSHASGVNPSSDPTGAAYTSSIPAQTAVTAFKSGGSQALISDGTAYYTATEYSSTYVWIQQPGAFGAGTQTNQGKTGTFFATRPVRRLVLS